MTLISPPPPLASGTTATLVGITRNCSTVSTFTWQLSAPADVPPGGAAIFDFSGVIGRQYQHMNAANPRTVNDDLLRTWTVTRKEAGGARLAVTVKRVNGGRVSTLLHSLAAQQQQQRPAGPGGAAAPAPPPPPPPLRVPLRGFGPGGLTCFGPGGAVPPRMTWLAGGIGITPFLAMHRALVEAGISFAASLLFSCRGDERLLAAELAADPRVSVRLFDSTAAAPGDGGGAGAAPLARRRLAAEDVLAAPGVAESTAFLCGPPGYMAAARGWLAQAGVPGGRIREESFAF